MAAAHRLTADQCAIVDAMCNPETNVQSTCCIVQAFGGSGKTFLLRKIAQQRFDKGLGCSLLITFAELLKSKLREDAGKQDGLVVENVHSLVRNHLNPGHDCLTDTDIDAYLQLDNKPPLRPDFWKHINFVIFDEIQDMNPTYHKVVEHLRSMFAPKIVSFFGVGDFFQSRGAHTRSSVEFMSNARAFFQHERFLEFVPRGIFRFGPKICDWINHNLDPRTIKLHYPECWEKYGEQILRFWGDGMVSFKCARCDQLHYDKTVCTQPPVAQRGVVEIRSRFSTETNTPLPAEADAFVKAHNAVVLLNGRRSQPFADTYHQVSNPFRFKGCEAERTVVVGCDRFTERVCAQEHNADNSEWPFAAYCQMLVSCTRASKQMAVVLSNAPFFTMRKHKCSVALEPLQPVKQQLKRQRGEVDDRIPLATIFADMQQADIERLSKWLEITPRPIDMPFDVSFALSNDEQRSFANAPHSQQVNLQDLVLRTVCAYAIDRTPLPQDWQHYGQKQVQERFATSGRMDAHLVQWLRKRTLALVACMEAEHIVLSSNFGARENFVFGNVKGKMDLFTQFGCLFVTFDTNKRAPLQHIASFLCCKFRGSQLKIPHLFAYCTCVDLASFTIYDIKLNVHSDAFMSSLSSKHATHLFDQTRFGPAGLLHTHLLHDMHESTDSMSQPLCA